MWAPVSFILYYIALLCVEISMNCTFYTLVGSECGTSSSNVSQSQTVIPLSQCQRDVSQHLRTVNVHDVSNEFELLLARAGVFEYDDELLAITTICPKHRLQLGGGWFQKKVCRYPEHKGKAKPDRTVSRIQSQSIYQQLGLLVPVGAGICTYCRKKLYSFKDTKDSMVDKTPADGADAEKEMRRCSRIAQCTPVDYAECSLLSPSEISTQFGLESSLTETPGYQPQAYRQPLQKAENVPVQKMNDFLASRDLSPVRYCVKNPWSNAADRTKREHLRKMKQGIVAVIETIAPGYEDEAWLDLSCSGVLDDHFNAKDTQKEPDLSLQALAAAYRASETRATEVQILSIIVDTFSHQQIQSILPEVTKYQLGQAKRHILSLGRGQPLKTVPKYRVGLTMPKIEHFVEFISSPHFVQDVAYGTRTVKLSSGETISMPNIVRNMISSRIIKQYITYCKETTFDHLSERELYRVLKYCPAQQKKALQGLDNTSADGLRGIEMLEDVLKKLGERGKDSAWVSDVCSSLSTLKRYLKGSYRLNISSSSRCPDHCSVFALSDPQKVAFSKSCDDHDHDLVCDDCERLGHLQELINASVSDPAVTFYSSDEKEDLLHDVKVSFEAIWAWKRHILRAVHQAKARQDTIDKLGSSGIFITQDFAMKFLPRRFKETQQEWFGKRGISWHISYCVRRTDTGEYEISVYSHLFQEKISQNSEVIAGIMCHTLKEEKARHPELKEAYYRSDCAGSYATGGVLIPIRHLEKLTGTTVRRYDFSEPQAGKGPCDRSAAHQKAHVNRFLNEGNDLTSAAHIKKALESHGGIQNVMPFVVGMPVVSSTTIPRIPEISLLHNFEYSDEGLRVWKAYGVGEGKLFPWESFDKDGQIQPIDLIIAESCAAPVNAHVQLRQVKPATKRKKANEEEVSRDEEDVIESSLFDCSEPGCVKQYITMGKLENHIAAGKHVFKEDSEPLGDQVMRKWVKQFENVASHNLPSNLENRFSSLQIKDSSTRTSAKAVEKGWALKKTKPTVRFPDKVRKYLLEKFDIGSKTGRKADPMQVAVDMRCARDEQGNRLFIASECLQTQQIRAFFSRAAAAKRNSIENPDEVRDEDIKDLEDDFEAENYEKEMNQVRQCVREEVSERHPIYFDRYNLCELSQQDKLKKRFSIDMLVKICEHYDLDIENVSRKRKEGLIAKIKEFLGSCSCSL